MKKEKYCLSPVGRSVGRLVEWVANLIFHGRKLIDNIYNWKKSKLVALTFHLSEANIKQTHKKRFGCFYYKSVVSSDFTKIYVHCFAKNKIFLKVNSEPPQKKSSANILSGSWEDITDTYLFVVDIHVKKEEWCSE